MMLMSIWTYACVISPDLPDIREHMTVLCA